MARATRRALVAPVRKPKADPDGVRLAVMPWKIDAVFAPLERVLSRIDIDGTVDTAKGRPVFREDSRGGWYEVAEALQGIIDFHRIAAGRFGWGIDLAPLERLHRKLDLDSPLLENDLASARVCIDTLKRHATTLTLGQAKGLLRDAKIGWELEKITEATA
ncbi:hypothetical protein OTERR_12670 [Oryzomicrobium terrae]|uniref:Uncharacterized protein n=2 Tax=Oryzomicrobium terrae TaxID=1735038 RepID=A0A5C1E7B4_9RHOO|nr:hypothetical protein OTERR_12670 [Oryzomicrobium terrae]